MAANVVLFLLNEIEKLKQILLLLNVLHVTEFVKKILAPDSEAGNTKIKSGFPVQQYISAMVKF